ncbi:hypothetical protein F5X98DRAFT_353715, partial [Xylaria grammica]
MDNEWTLNHTHTLGILILLILIHHVHPYHLPILYSSPSNPLFSLSLFFLSFLSLLSLHPPALLPSLPLSSTSNTTLPSRLGPAQQYLG